MLFSGTVLAIPERQLQPSGNLKTFPGGGHPGRVPVFITIDDPDFDKDDYPDGLYGRASGLVYSEHLHHVAIMRVFCCAWQVG